MGIEIDKIVDVVISKETQVVKQTGFGVPLILGPNAAFLSKTRSYDSLVGVAEDFATSTDEYKAANAIFAQPINVEQIKIGKQAAKVAQVTVLSFNINFVALNSIAYKIDGEAQTPVVFDTDQATTITALAAAIQAHPKIATAQVTDTREITITAQTPGVAFSISDVLVTLGVTQPIATIANTVENHGLVEDLIDIIHVDNDWYALIVTSRNEDEIKQVAEFIETQKKIFLTCSDDADILSQDSVDDLAAALNLKNYDRTGIIYNGVTEDFADAAWLGRCLPVAPGGLTFANKELIGITPDNLTVNQFNVALGKNCNVYVEVGGVGITRNGVMASGEYIDIVRDIDWLQSRIQEEIFFNLVNQNKIPYTDAGVAVILNILKGVLSEAVSVGVLASYEEPTAPKVADVSALDKANRLLPDVKFSGILAGAIHTIKINGVVSL